MSPSWKQRILPGLTILPIALLTGCNHAPPTIASQFCPVPVHAAPAVRAWLKSKQPPDYVVHYFKLIADEQEAIETACPQ